ncbi:MAG: NAD(+)/NADH kinase [Christensenellales bacterium]
MKLGVVINNKKFGCKDQADHLMNSIKNAGIQLYGPIDLSISSRSETDQFFSDIDFVMVLGGDGTILTAAREASRRDIPILGVNLGHIGFLSEIESDHVQHSLQRLAQGDYKIEKRMMIEAKYQGESFPALNDAGVLRPQYARIINLQVSIDGKLWETWACDGVLVSTPTGSTAYSLSAGGPIVSPDMECMVVTPVNSHTLRARSLVVSPGRKIHLHLLEENAVLFCDGRAVAQEVKSVDVVRSNLVASFIRFNGFDFFALLHHKLSV